MTVALHPMKRFFLTGAALLAATVTAPAQTNGNDAVTELAKDTSLLSMVASAITVSLIIFCFFTLTEKSITSPELLERMEPFFENEDLEGLAHYVAERPQATARIVDRILKFLERHPDADPDSIRIVAETEGNRIAAA